MNGRELLLALGSVDDVYVEEAENTTILKKHIPWVQIAGIAACLCLIISAAHHVSLDNVATESFLESDGMEFVTESNQSLVMRYVEVTIDAVTEFGFSATVTDPIEDDIFTTGMTVYVISESGAGEYTLGDRIHVWFREYDPATQTITAETLTDVQ